MAFSTDVFISYAHLDNQSASPSQEGWISEFERALSLRLGEVWGRPPRIWRDPKLQGNDVFADELDARYREAAVLVSVVTPRYVQSDWCQRELTGFWQAAGQTGGAVLGNKARVFKVVKTPVDLQRLPAPAQSLLGYEFYRQSGPGARPLEFNRLYGPEAEREFWLRMNDLAYDVADTLTLLENASAPPAEDRGAAYLATTPSDMAPQRDALRRELQRQGWTVYPDAELPLIEAECATAVRAQLARCTVSIHLIGAAYGIVPEGGTHSLPQLQADAAGERARGGGLDRLVWLAPDTPRSDARQTALVAALRDDPSPSTGSDLLETDADELTALALKRLQAGAERLAAERARAAAAQPSEAAGAPALQPPGARIYLICSLADLDAVLAMRADLFDQGFEVSLPLFEGDEADLRRAHENELRDCDGLLVYYGEGSALWLQEQLAQLRRLPALGRSSALRASAICIAPPGSQAKQLLLTREARMLRMPQGYAPELLRPFTDSLQAQP